MATLQEISEKHRIDDCENEPGENEVHSVKGRTLLLCEHTSPEQYNICRYFPPLNQEKDDVITHCKVYEHEVALPYNMKGNLQNLGLPEFILSHIRYEYF